NRVDSASYVWRVTPQAMPTISNGTTTYFLPAGNFSQLAANQTLNTSGTLTIDTSGDKGLLVPLVMPYMIVGGSITGSTGSNGNAAPIVLFSNNDMTLANGASTNKVS